MAVVTASQVLNKKDDESLTLQVFPVESGETIYQNTLAGVNENGYLVNLTSGNYQKIRMVVVVADDSSNSSGPIATTSSGSISGNSEESSPVAGDKTVRQCWIRGRFLLPMTNVLQNDVGKVVYAQNNFTVDETQLAGTPIGTLVSYVGSSTSAWIDLNAYYKPTGGEITIRGTIAKTTATTPGLPFNVQNPFNEPALVTEILIDTTTASTASATIDVGVSTTSTIGSDNLIDGGIISAIGIINNIVRIGKNGGMAKALAHEYVTATTVATGTDSWAGTYSVTFRRWE